MKKFIFSLLLITLFHSFIISVSLNAQSKKKLTAQQVLDMSLDEAFEEIRKLNKEETKVLIDQIRVEAKKDYPNIEKFYLLISHLESIKAIEEEKSRLKDLNLVYALGLTLFLSVLLYTLYSQRKALARIQQYKQE